MDIKTLSQEIERISSSYASNFGIERDSSWFVLKLQEELGELIQSYLMLSGKARTKGKTSDEIRKDFEAEVADVFCHVLLLANNMDVDLERNIEEKWLKYKT
jgi:NTP pyrophosphatase (non-canonical NTP hydrolase)